MGIDTGIRLSQVIGILAIVCPKSYNKKYTSCVLNIFRTCLNWSDTFLLESGTANEMFIISGNNC